MLDLACSHMCDQLCLTLCYPMDSSPPAQDLLSMGFSRQEYWSGFPFLPSEDLPKPGIEPSFPVSPALQGDSLPRGLYFVLQYKKISPDNLKISIG